ncbi:stromal cell-derived factor 2-like protein 1 [Leucoraja erinacea]|uniref:stromal cell-derived factor 2-like protein 1 n=1 Tax=Leucoraja erinaceus TaxID=7782 RepID=UPI00245652CF|nr:stromal cell-derived factor 2-like protein 1 [Leucoraja erinacea]
MSGERGRARSSTLGLALCALLSALALTATATATEQESVTCGSVVKLLNNRHNVRLHSHDVKYGSGSGQQSVTGVSVSDDSNSYWTVRGKPGLVCQRGIPIKCGQPIRLTHVNTGRNLHSHHFVSPLSGNQEVSAFGENGDGDDLDVWTVQCGGTSWERDDDVRLKHVGTQAFLTITGEQYGHPIRGQLEVHGTFSPNANNYWTVMEGVFIKPSAEPLKHDEL